MAVRIRLTRVGAKKQPTYRFVVADSRNARDGRSLATLGHYNPRTEPIEINVDAERAKEWMSRGAKPSDTVDRLFRQVGVLPKLAQPVRPTAPARGPKKGDKTTKAAKRAAAAAAPKETSPAPTAQAASADEPAEGAVEAVAEVEETAADVETTAAEGTAQPEEAAAAEPEATAEPTEEEG